jgi:hypothetical protein
MLSTTQLDEWLRVLNADDDQANQKEKSYND